LNGNGDAPGSSRARFLSGIPPGARAAAVVLALAASGIGGGWLAKEELRYLEPGELERAPFPERRIDVPAIAERGGATFFGKVKLRVYIRKGGDVDHVEVESTTVPRDVAEAAARRFAAVRWEPGTRNGRKRRSVYIVELDFQPPEMGPRRLTPES
jgi:hypothetical protein